MPVDLTEEQIRHLLGGISIPPQPQIMVDLQMEQFDPNCSMDKIVQLNVVPETRFGFDIDIMGDSPEQIVISDAKASGVTLTVALTASLVSLSQLEIVCDA